MIQRITFAEEPACGRWDALVGFSFWHWVQAAMIACPSTLFVTPAARPREATSLRLEVQRWAE